MHASFAYNIVAYACRKAGGCNQRELEMSCGRIGVDTHAAAASLASLAAVESPSATALAGRAGRPFSLNL